MIGVNKKRNMMLVLLSVMLTDSAKYLKPGIKANLQAWFGYNFYHLCHNCFLLPVTVSLNYADSVHARFIDLKIEP